MFEDVLRFWLDRGVDGFRIDVAHGLYKAEGLPDQVGPDGVAQRRQRRASMVERGGDDEPMWDQPEVHDVYRRWHEVLDEYDGDRMAVAEAWTPTPESMARYVRPDELSQAFNFAWLLATWSAPAFAEVITGTLAAVEPVGASPTWVLSNHDVIRHPTPVRRRRARPGPGPGRDADDAGAAGLGVPLPGRGARPRAGRRRARSTGRTRPGSAPASAGRDGCRVPIPWSGDEPPFGFGPGDGQPWIPQPDDWATLTVEAQQADPDSTLSFYRAALAARRTYATPAGEIVELLDGGDGRARVPARRR